jgi:hypothetical protein
MSHTQTADKAQEVLCDNQPGVYCWHVQPNPQTTTETAEAAASLDAAPLTGGGETATSDLVVAAVVLVGVVVGFALLRRFRNLGR